MENIDIVISKKTRMIDRISRTIIGNDGENLQENIVFSFSDEFVNGQARLELIMPDRTKSFITLTKEGETYQTPVLSVITRTGKIMMQLVVTEGVNEEEIPIFKSNIFYLVVNNSINFIGEPPENYNEWLEIANTKLNQMDNFDIDATKEDNVTTITITNREGTEKSVEILDGEQGPQGIQGPAGKDGKDGVDGQDATINGVNTLSIEAGDNITLEQEGSTLIINATGGGAVSSVNGQTGDVVIDIPDVSGLQDKITSSNKLNSDLVDDTNQTNKFVSASEKTTWNNKSNFSGSYNDLTNKPSLFSGDYNDLTNKPTIPTVPTNVSAFTNDAGYLTQHQDISGKLDTSKVKSTYSTTAGDVYASTYINGLIGDINTILATLTTPGGNE